MFFFFLCILSFFLTRVMHTIWLAFWVNLNGVNHQHKHLKRILCTDDQSLTHYNIIHCANRLVFFFWLVVESTHWILNWRDFLKIIFKWEYLRFSSYRNSLWPCIFNRLPHSVSNYPFSNCLKKWFRRRTKKQQSDSVMLFESVC